MSPWRRNDCQPPVCILCASVAPEIPRPFAPHALARDENVGQAYPGLLQETLRGPPDHRGDA